MLVETDAEVVWLLPARFVKVKGGARGARQAAGNVCEPSTGDTPGGAGSLRRPAGVSGRLRLGGTGDAALRLRYRPAGGGGRASPGPARPGAGIRGRGGAPGAGAEEGGRRRGKHDAGPGVQDPGRSGGRQPPVPGYGGGRPPALRPGRLPGRLPGPAAEAA